MSLTPPNTFRMVFYIPIAFIREKYKLRIVQFEEEHSLRSGNDTENAKYGSLLRYGHAAEQN